MGELGIGYSIKEEEVVKPEIIPLNEDIDLVEISCGDFHSLSIDTDHK